MINSETAEALVLAAIDRIDVEPIQIDQVAELLRSTGRYGDEASETVVHVLAALHVVRHGSRLEDFPR